VLTPLVPTEATAESGETQERMITAGPTLYGVPYAILVQGLVHVMRDQVCIARAAELRLVGGS
jgi:hypothetical protein